MPQRVLHIISSTMRAGVEMMVMNIYREINREKLQFDFIAHDLGRDDLGKEIESLGGKVFKIPLLSKSGIPQFLKTLGDIIVKNGPYAAIHAHTDFQGGFSAMAAKKAGVPVRICHAHSDTRVFHSLQQNAKNLLGRYYINRHATQRCACSRNAALSLFGIHAVENGLVKIIPNSIDLSGYYDFKPDTHKMLLKTCKSDENCLLIGFVGRLNPVKNPSFILEMAAEAKKRGLHYRFVIVGSGEMEEQLIQKMNLLSLEQNVFFTGTREDIPDIMQCFDLTVIPSLTEGFSMTALESQAAGTPVLAAQCVPREADMGLGLMNYMRLEAGAASWVEKAGEIIKSTIRPDAGKRIGMIREKGHDSKSNTAVLIKLYGL